MKQAYTSHITATDPSTVSLASSCCNRKRRQAEPIEAESSKRMKGRSSSLGCNQHKFRKGSVDTRASTLLNYWNIVNLGRTTTPSQLDALEVITGIKYKVIHRWTHEHIHPKVVPRSPDGVSHTGVRCHTSTSSPLFDWIVKIRVQPAFLRHLACMRSRGSALSDLHEGLIQII